MLERDIIERVERDFGFEGPLAVEMLRESKFRGRVARCVVVAAGGRLAALREWIAIGKADARDAILAGEYDSMHRHVRDLTVPFGVGELANSWVIRVTQMMGERGYVLSALESRPATAGSFVYGTDEGEGIAAYDGLIGRVTITKKDRHWTLRGDRTDLAMYRLDRPYDNEAAFIDQLSCYLVAKHNPAQRTGPDRDSPPFAAR